MHWYFAAVFLHALLFLWIREGEPELQTPRQNFCQAVLILCWPLWWLTVAHALISRWDYHKAVFLAAWERATKPEE